MKLIILLLSLVASSYALPQSGELGDEVSTDSSPITFGPGFRYNPDEDSYRKYPRLDQLPTIPDAPKGAAWFWGPDDGLGRLNLQTTKRLKRAAREIKSGDFTAMQAPAYRVANPALFSRTPTYHGFSQFGPDPTKLINDERLELNAQSSSQFDGFRHFAHQPSKLFYNFCRQSDIRGPDPQQIINTKCGIQEWAEKGIAGRGILVDVAGYVKAKGMEWDPLKEGGKISLGLLREAAESQGLKLRRKDEGYGDLDLGDVLMIRTGWYEAYGKLSQGEKDALAAKGVEVGAVGLEASEEMKRFLHDAYFSAIVADNPGLESLPLPGDGESLHESLLALWGVPIGELWNLDKLAALCRKNGRWKVVLTAAPFNIDGGVASWANSIAML